MLFMPKFGDLKSRLIIIYDVSPFFFKELQMGKIVVNTEIKQNVNKIKYDMNIGKSC